MSKVMTTASKLPQSKESLMPLLNVLNKLGLDEALAINDILSLTQSIPVCCGDILLRQDGIQSHVFFVAAGILKACHYNDNGNNLSKEFYFTNELCFLYSSWLTGQTAQYQIEVVEDALILQFPISLLSQPLWQAVKISLLSQQLIYKEQKEAFLLLNTPEQRYRFLTEYRPNWVQKLNNIQLASYIGITPVSLSRLKSRIPIN
ncbi:Crp/Fnr family transcriptional regulator [Shewanella sp. c952]|uniref:Crp/Fnr family transcriptional regulator n=1 Tax=Shewanella sp. c952 TaxID=2815913 RepID=UPI00217F2FA4|nr:Crp/Fnr family transcriptional regulator [Shewanella sp. c952]